MRILSFIITIFVGSTLFFHFYKPSKIDLDFKVSKTPQALIKPHTFKLHHNTIHDDYAWLRDPQWSKIQDPEILKYLQEEKNYTDSFFKNLSDLQETIFQEIKSRIQEDDQSYPVITDGYFYYEIRTDILTLSALLKYGIFLLF